MRIERAGDVSLFSNRLISQNEAASVAHQRLYEYGKGLFMSDHYREGAHYLDLSKERFLKAGQSAMYMNCCDILLSCFQSLDDQRSIHELQQELDEMSFQYGFKKSARLLFSLSLAERERDAPKKKVFDILIQALNRALEIRQAALAKGDSAGELKGNIDIMYALFMFCCFRIHFKEYEKARSLALRLQGLLLWIFKLKESLTEQKSKSENAQEQRRLQAVLNVFEENQAGLRNLKIDLAMERAKIEQNSALSQAIYQGALQKCVKIRSLNRIPYIFLYMAESCFLRSERKKAEMYMDLAQERALEIECQHVIKKCRRLEESFVFTQKRERKDIIADRAKRSVIVKGKGLVHLKKRRILWELLQALIEAQGTETSKEALKRRLWKSPAAPQTCLSAEAQQNADSEKSLDNKLYVAVKRLRMALEPAGRRLIFRSRKGYFLDPQLKISAL